MKQVKDLKSGDTFKLHSWNNDWHVVKETSETKFGVAILCTDSSRYIGINPKFYVEVK